jgi:hypothetical protein
MQRKAATRNIWTSSSAFLKAGAWPGCRTMTAAHWLPPHSCPLDVVDISRPLCANWVIGQLSLTGEDARP